ncbi:NUDIX domain-containing protein [Candidatus Kaiserbacteria bacterium]|nr:NUDIX domain-containing protein [Candidatus Kaiserbacteria bacterium]
MSIRTYIPKDAKVIPGHAEKVFSGVIFDVYQWPQEMYDGTTETFEMLKRPDTVRAIAIRDNKLVVLEQEQPVVGAFFDVPGGRHDFEGETELEAVQRETKEECGMQFGNWRLLKVDQPHTKIDWLVYTFLATDFIDEVPQELESGEKITVHLKTFDEVKMLLRDPRARSLGADILEHVDSIDELLELPSIE